jgi:hypothetical protein
MPLRSIFAHSKAPLAIVSLLLVVGAVYRTASGQPEVAPPVHRIFKVAAAMITPRQEHDATLLTNGMVLITGGMNARKQTLANAELFNPATGRFSPTGNMNVERVFHTGHALSIALPCSTAEPWPARS